MAYRIVLLAENQLTPEEVQTVTSLHDDDAQSFYLLMPAQESHHGLVAASMTFCLATSKRRGATSSSRIPTRR